MTGKGKLQTRRVAGRDRVRRNRLGNENLDVVSGSQPESRLVQLLQLLERWGPTAGRYLLGVVFCWFGIHEVWHPSLWTGYVPILATGSQVALVLVVLHGDLLLLLSAALLLGIAPRLAALIGSGLLFEIVCSLILPYGLNDIAMRDLGILGLAVTVAAGRHRLLIST